MSIKTSHFTFNLVKRKKSRKLNEKFDIFIDNSHKLKTLFTVEEGQTMVTETLYSELI